MNRREIDAYIAHARQLRSEAAGELIFRTARGASGLFTDLLKKLRQTTHPTVPARQ
jgi:hypothetical protein